MLKVAPRYAALELPEQWHDLEPRIPRGDHPLGPRPASPFACVSTPKGEVAETGAAAGGVIVEAGGGESKKEASAEHLVR
jgi:hypothetical protein